MSSNPQSVNGSESDFEFIETPKAPTPTFEKFEECGVRTTSVSLFYRFCLGFGVFAKANWMLIDIVHSIPPSRMRLSQQMVLGPRASPTSSFSPSLDSSLHTSHGSSAED